MAQQTINVGTSANSGGGDPLRNALIKVNENFTEVYADIAALQDGNVVTDIKGNVFADDSTLLVDGVAGKIVGPVEASTITSSSYVDASSVNANTYGAKTVGSFINFGVNASVVNMTAAIDMGTYSIGNAGTITASQYNGTNLSVDTGSFISITGDLTGSVFADDSTLLVDGVNGLVVGEVDTSYVTTENGIGFGQTGYTMAVDEGGTLYITGTNGDDDVVIRTNSSGSGQYDWTFGIDGSLEFPGTVIHSTDTTTGGLNASSPTTLDVTKTVLVLNSADTNDDSWLLPDGVEGQVIHLVPGTGTATNQHYVQITNWRKWDDGAGEWRVRTGLDWTPFVFENTTPVYRSMATAVFVNGAWHTDTPWID